MPRCRLFDEDGSDVGEARYAAPIRPADEVWTPDHRKVCVLELLPFDDDETTLAGALRVRPA
jgi:hypothetical protein